MDRFILYEWYIYKIYNADFDLLYKTEKFRTTSENKLMKNCLDLQNYLSDGHSYNIIVSKLYEKLMMFFNEMDQGMNAIVDGNSPCGRGGKKLF